MLWIYEDKTGRRLTAQLEDAAEMVKPGRGYSCLSPRGTEKEESEEFERLKIIEESINPTPTPPEKKKSEKPDAMSSRKTSRNLDE